MTLDQLLVISSIAAALGFFVLRQLRLRKSSLKGDCGAGCGCGTKSTLKATSQQSNI
jgi:hypothetical protein